ncbi:MAG: TIGR03086 family metal-binding protein, partial [Nocardioides sp.]
VLRHLTVEDQPKQTPCSEFTCHDLAEHLFGSITGLGSMAGATVTDPETGPLEHRVATMAAQAIEGWRARGLDGTVPSPAGGEMPAAMAAGILSVEFLLHGWDFAQTSGQEVVVSDEVVDYVRSIAEKLVPGARERGAFAEEKTPAADANPLERLAAYAGRTPIAT